jgi:predicted flap endonuclease-1-like 5' DNA nuclease
MRKRIKSADFANLLSVDIQELKTAKQQAHEAKKQAKAKKNAENDTLTKEEKQALKVAFIRTKIRHKAAKHAWKAAHKVLAPYLIADILEGSTTEKKVEKKTNKKAGKKSIKHQPDVENEATPAKEQGIKKNKVKATKAEKTKAKADDKAQKKAQAKSKNSIKTKVATTVVSETAKPSVVTTQATPTPTKVTITNGVSHGGNTTAASSETKMVTVSTTTKTPAKPDNLTLIEGIGAKIAEVLVNNGVTTFKQLSLLAPDYIKDILHKNRLQLADPTTWAEQARLAADGKMEQLETLKKELKRGKRT